MNEKMIDGVASIHAANGLATHDLSTKGIGVVGLNILDFGEVDAVFVAERKIVEEVFEREDAAFGKQLGALRTDSLEHANFGLETDGHVSSFISLWRKLCFS